MKLYIGLFLYLIVGFVPYFGTIDKIGSQWLYLSILNFFLLILNYKNNKLSIFITFTPFLLYSIFVIFCAISLIYTNNISISIIDFSRIFVTLLSVYNLLLLLNEKNFSIYNFSILISVILFFEIIFSLFPLIKYVFLNDIQTIDFTSVPNALKGITGNKNVMSSNIAFKIPFIIYLIIYSKNNLKYLYSLFFALSLLNLFLLSSRAAFISCSLVLIFYSIYLIFNYGKISISSFLSLIFPLIFISIFTFFTNSIDNISITNRVSSISTTDTSTSHRLTLYENAIDYILENPIIGCGIGNWKVESLPYWKTLLSGYTIPYHAHNDFLEITTEIGLIGGLAYLLLFVTIFYYSIILIIKKKLVGYVLISISSVYFIDAFLNFPLERALSQANFIILLLLSYTFIKNEKINS
ncbi:MAG: O-antigen ligase family protein [Flavobacteriaceae bacterium]|nr:O-antigen ligase family protein [Flavobacteriaceae bacterium]MCI5087799.1 O-antigen ligase family protein [Flavobacteriaceae bacterium]